VTWCEICKDLTEKQIKSGFKNFMNSDEDFLDAKKFRNFCLQKTEHDTTWEAYKVLPRANRLEDQGKKDRSVKARSKHITSIRAMLSGAN